MMLQRTDLRLVFAPVTHRARRVDEQQHACMASQQPFSRSVSRGPGYKRASRQGAPRRFACDHPGCDKIYSRAEHLQRHQLNHNPKEIFRCDIGDCAQKFVRPDLLARHKKRHTASYTPRNRIPSFDDRITQQVLVDPAVTTHDTSPLDSAMPLTLDSDPAPPSAFLHHPLPGAASHGSLWASAVEGSAHGGLMALPWQNLYRGQPEASNFVHSGEGQLLPGNFAAWLFDPQTTNYSDFTVTNTPFLEDGLQSTFDHQIHYDYDSLNSLSPIEPPSRNSDFADGLITETRRQDVLYWFRVFRKKQPKYESLIASLVHEEGGDMPSLNLEILQDCLNEFWDKVSPRLPIIHQHTFSARDCSIFLLLVMISLGAASLRHRDTTGQMTEFGSFADVIVASVRWEIMTADEAAPPVGLWVAQALLLLEYYEKLHSSRRFHERAHIYHSAFLTLLRRGSPLIGRAGSESPPEAGSAGAEGKMAAAAMALDARSWWIRWAERESMHRVVFAAFMLDIMHAAMFGHTADMAAYEIRLPLPCHEDLWTASSADMVRQLDTSLRMYGFRQTSFLDGLKCALHGKEVNTYAFGRTIIVCGLLSVGWHLNHKETQLKWLGMRTTPTEAQGNWRWMLLRALGKWKDSFDMAGSAYGGDASSGKPVSSEPVNSGSLLFHLAHISLHANIIDCQVYAGDKRLLGRKVSSRDRTNVAARMTTWAKQPLTRHAILHAFKLLYRVLVDGQRTASGHNSPGSARVAAQQYSIHDETDPHSSWIMYYAVLVIWAFVQAVGRSAGKGFPLRPSQLGHSTYARMAEYLGTVARLSDLNEATAATLHEGLPELLDVVEDILEEADTELLQEARERLCVCRDMLLEG